MPRTKNTRKVYKPRKVKPKAEQVSRPSLCLEDLQIRQGLFNSIYFESKDVDIAIIDAQKAYDFVKGIVAPTAILSVDLPETGNKDLSGLAEEGDEPAEAVAPKKHFETGRMLM